jgi:hypothetical protein
MTDNKARKSSDTERLQRPWSLLLPHFEEQETDSLMTWMRDAQAATQRRWDAAKKISTAGDESTGKRRMDASNSHLLRALATLGVIAAHYDLKKGEKHGNA